MPDDNPICPECGTGLEISTNRFIVAARLKGARYGDMVPVEYSCECGFMEIEGAIEKEYED